MNKLPLLETQNTENTALAVFSKCSLSNVADVIMGQSPEGDTYNEIGIGLPLLNGPTEFGASHPVPVAWTTAPTKVCKVGDLLFCVRGSTTGRMNWADQPYCLGRGVAAIRAKESSYDTKFIYYSLVNGLSSLLSSCDGSVFPSLSGPDFKAFKLDWPNPKDRYDVAATLGALDDKIELNSRMNRTLEQIGQTLFRAWFVDFEPVRAKREGRTPHGMDAETAARFPERLRLTEVGEIPEGWHIGTLGEVAMNVRAGVQPETMPPETPYIGLEHMPRRSIALGEWGRAGDVGSGKSGFRAGDILFGKLRPYFHKVGVAVVDGVCSTDIVVMRPQQSEWYGFTLFHAASVDFVNYTDAHSAGTKMPRTNWQDMAHYEVVLPDEAVARAFNDTVQPLVERIQANIRQSHTLAALRDALLPKLLSGEIRVPLE